MKKLIIILILLAVGFLHPQMKTSLNGINCIVHYEGIQTHAYGDVGGILTIGFGHTGNVFPGQVISRDGAIKLLKGDLRAFEKYVNGSIDRQPLSQNEFDALTSLTFNIGYRLNNELKYSIDNGNTNLTILLIRQHNRVHGIIIPGLVKRRNTESILYSTGVLRF